MFDTIAPAVPFVNSLDLEITALPTASATAADDAWTDVYTDELVALAEAQDMLESDYRSF